MPPPTGATFPDRVDWFTVSVPPDETAPPPVPRAATAFPESVHWFSVSVPAGLAMAPPEEAELFPNREQRLTVSVPLLRMPPPVSEANPSVMVSAFKTTVLPLGTLNARELLLPEIRMPPARLHASMVMVMGLERVMGPLVSKMLDIPPAKISAVCGSAALTSWRNEPGPESLFAVTTW